MNRYKKSLSTINCRPLVGSAGCPVDRKGFFLHKPHLKRIGTGFPMLSSLSDSMNLASGSALVWCGSVCAVQSAGNDLRVSTSDLQTRKGQQTAALIRSGILGLDAKKMHQRTFGPDALETVAFAVKIR